MRLPCAQIPHCERMLAVAAHRAVVVVAEVETVEPLRVRLVILKPDERQRADIALDRLAVFAADSQHGIEAARLRNLESEAVFLVLARDISREGIATVRPPEARAVVWVEGQDLLGQRARADCLHREIAVEEVPLLRGVLHKVAVSARAVAHAIAHDEVVGAVDGDPAVVGIPDARARHTAAAHRVAHQVKVDGVFPEHAFFAEVAKLRVADAARGIAVIHRVAAHAIGLRAFHHDIARKQRRLAAHHPLAQMLVFERRIERHPRAVDLQNTTLLRGSTVAAARCFFHGRGVVLLARTRDDQLVAFTPSRRLRFELQRRRTRSRRGRELQPRPRHGGAVNIPTPATRHNRRQRLAVHPLEIRQPDHSLHRGGNRIIRRPDFQRRQRAAGRDRRIVMTIETILAARITGSHPQQPDIEARVLCARKTQRAGNVHHSQRGR